MRGGGSGGKVLLLLLFSLSRLSLSTLPPLFIFSLSFFLVSPAPSPSLPRAGRISQEVIYFHAREALTECVGRG